MLLRFLRGKLLVLENKPVEAKRGSFAGQVDLGEDFACVR